MRLFELIEKLSKIEDKQAYVTVRSNRSEEDCMLYQVEVETKINYKKARISEVHLIG